MSSFPVGLEPWIDMINYPPIFSIVCLIEKYKTKFLFVFQSKTKQMSLISWDVTSTWWF